MLIAKHGSLALLRRLREVGARPQPRLRIGRWPKTQPPLGLAREYGSAITEHLTGARAAFAEVEPEILELLAGLRTEQGRTDAAPRGLAEAIAAAIASGAAARERDETSLAAGLASAEWRGRKARVLIEKAARVFARKLRPDALLAAAKKFGQRTSDHSRAQLDAQMRSAIGVPLSSVERPMQDKLGGWADENVALIKTVPERYFDRLSEDVQDAFAGGTHPTVLKGQLAERYHMSERDADGIARDQVLRLSSDLHQARMESLGVTRAIWHTMRDNRVSDDCYDREGVEYPLATGIDGKHPGKAHPGCRCFREPILDDILGPRA